MILLQPVASGALGLALSHHSALFPLSKTAQTMNEDDGRLGHPDRIKRVRFSDSNRHLFKWHLKRDTLLESFRINGCNFNGRIPKTLWTDI